MNDIVEKTLRFQIDSINEGIELLQKQLTKHIEELRKICKHDLIAEAPYKAETSCSYAKPPMRVCERCGITEDGWGVGYQKLTTDIVRKVTIFELFKIRDNIE